jgi:curved DNA-binding protein
MEFQDYYQILKVSRSASAEEIQKAYRKLARQYHPDVNKDKGAEDHFKKVSEAYEVLKNPESRRKYDALGKNWKGGDPFQTPRGWQNVDFNFGRQGEQSGFSDFFDMIFGRESEVTITLEEAYSGVTKTLHPSGVTVHIPAGATTGSRLRLKEQGLIVNIRVAPHRHFRVEGRDLIATVAISPWEAALGATVEVPTLTGKVRVKVPAGSQSDSVMRLKGKGMLSSRKEAGDLRLELKIHVPTMLSEQERELFQKLSEVSTFNPR